MSDSCSNYCCLIYLHVWSGLHFTLKLQLLPLRLSDQKMVNLTANVGENARVYKEECLYCFRSPEAPGGVYLSLLATDQDCFFAFCPAHVHFYLERFRTSPTNSSAVTFLHYVRRKRERKQEPMETDAENEKGSGIKKLAIGVEGGFAAVSCLNT